MRGLPKIFVFLLFFSVFSSAVLFLPRPARAAILQEENQCIISGQCPGGTVSGEGFDDKAFNLNQMAGTVDSLNYLLAGQSEAHPELIALGNGGAIGAMGTLISKLYQPPASSVQYLAYLRENLGLATPAYAQGTGFSGLSPLLPIWTVFRNAAYLVFIILFVITGLLIMFRLKVSPQAVITIQTALPRLLFTLILITLSYAIAGLMIDLMYVFIFFLLNLLQSAAGFDLGNLRNFQNQNVFQYWSGGARLGFDIINESAAGISTIIESITGDTFVISGFLSTPARGIATAVITIAILFALFKLFLILLKAYVWVLVLVIFGPFMLLIGALPGRNGLSTWLRGLLANLSVFPTTILMFVLAAIFIGLTKTAPVETSWSAPLIGGSDPNAVQALIGLGMILLTPQVAQMMNDAFKPAPFPYGVAIGQAIGAGPATMRGGTQRLMAGLIPAARPGERQPLRILTG